MPLELAFLMDPLENVRIDADSTFALMLAAQARGHRLWVAHPRELDVREGRVGVEARRVEVRRVLGITSLGELQTIALDDTDAVFMRLDPPFDELSRVRTCSTGSIVAASCA